MDTHLTPARPSHKTDQNTLNFFFVLFDGTSNCLLKGSGGSGGSRGSRGSNDRDSDCNVNSSRSSSNYKWMLLNRCYFSNAGWALLPHINYGYFSVALFRWGEWSHMFTQHNQRQWIRTQLWLAAVDTSRSFVRFVVIKRDLWMFVQLSTILVHKHTLWQGCICVVDNRAARPRPFRCVQPWRLKTRRSPQSCIRPKLSKIYTST